MKVWILLLFAVCAALAAEVHETTKKHVIDDQVMLKRQMNIVRLFRYINQPSFFDDFIKIGRSFNPQQKELYTVPSVVDEFYWYYRNNFIQKDDVFSLGNDQQLQQAIALFRMFYYAKDYDTFYNIGVWARQNINAYMFVYSFSVAFLHRQDTEGLVLPPIYEIFPQFFFSTDVIQQAQMFKQLYHQQEPQGQYPRSFPGESNRQWPFSQRQNVPQHYQESSDEEYHTEYPEGQGIRQGQYSQGRYPQEQYAQGKYSHGEYPEGQQEYTRYSQQFPEYNTNNGYTVFANYSGQNPMSYYLEDVGLNAQYYYFNLYYPSWMTEEYKVKKDRPDVAWYELNKYLLARFYLERLSNGLGDIPVLDWEEPIETGYNPQLTYFNGYSFPARPSKVFVNEEVSYLQEFEMMNVTYDYGDLIDWTRRIKDAIDLGYVYSNAGVKIPIYNNNTGFEIFAGMIRGSVNSPNYKFYGSIYDLARYLLGYSYKSGQYQNGVPIPSALEQLETAIRDPVYYQMTKWIMQFFQRYTRSVPRYTKKDMVFNGVEIRNVQVDRLVTYFDYFYSDLSNAVYYSPQEQPQNFNVRVRQQRLNHKPFGFSLNVNSNTAGNAMVTVWLGPKHDQYGQNAQWYPWNWFKLDQFAVKLQPGPNTINRNDREYFYRAGDQCTFRQLYMNAMNAMQGQQTLHVDGRETSWGFPYRLSLPKGTISGQKYQMYFLISAMNRTISDVTTFPRPGSLGANYMSTTPGFPFDRYAPKSVYQVPNAFFKDVVIIQKNYEDTNPSYWSVQ